MVYQAMVIAAHNTGTCWTISSYEIAKDVPIKFNSRVAPPDGYKVAN